MAKKKTPSDAPSGRARMEKELRQAIDEVDDEGLLFLLRQAQVLVHNARVDRLNRETAAPRKGTGGAAGGQPAAPARTLAAGVSFEQAEGGKAVFLTIGGARKVMTTEELKRLVRICYSAESKSEALAQLYKVLSLERNDILFDARIGGAGSPLMEQLFHAIRSAYKLKDR
jgi:hypothetical protein